MNPSTFINPRASCNKNLLIPSNKPNCAHQNNTLRVPTYYVQMQHEINSPIKLHLLPRALPKRAPRGWFSSTLNYSSSFFPFCSPIFPFPYHPIPVSSLSLPLLHPTPRGPWGVLKAYQYAQAHVGNLLSVR